MTIKKYISFILLSFFVFSTSHAQVNVKRDVLAAVKLHGKWGYINTDGLMVIQPGFDGAASFSETFATVKANGFWGYIDRSGAWKLAPALFRAGGFNNGRAHVIFLDLPDSIFYQVYMNKIGSYVHEIPLTEMGWSYHDGLVRARGTAGLGELLWGYKDTMGEWSITPKYQEAQDFSEGFAGVMIGNKWGYIDRTDSFIAPSVYDEVFLFHNGYGRVKKGNEYMLVNRKGEVVLSSNKELDYMAAEDRIGFTENGKYGFLDLNGKVIVKPEYEPMAFNHFSESLAVVSRIINGSQKYGYIDINGKEVIPPQFEYALPFEHGLALVKKGDRYGFIDKTGAMKIPAIYEDGKSFAPTY